MESRDVAQKKSRLIKRVALPLAFGLAGLGLFGAGQGGSSPEPKQEQPPAAAAIKGSVPPSLQAGIRW